MTTVTSAELHRFQVPMQGSYRSAHHDAFAEMDAELVVLEADDGTTGIGTADPIPGYSPETAGEVYHSLGDELLPAILAESPGNLTGFYRFADRFDERKNALCALEMAYLDLYCRHRNLKLVDFFGGALEDVEPLNGWVGVEPPEVAAAEARWWRDDGFESLKVKLGGDLDKDVARVRAVCEAVGGADGMQIRTDANCGYDLEVTLRLVRELDGLPIEHLEQPIPADDTDGLRQLRTESSIPIVADEAVTDVEDVYRILQRSAADRFKFKIPRLGGVNQTLLALDLAKVGDRACVVGHGFALSPTASAELQLVAARNDVLLPAESVGPMKMIDEPFNPTLIAKDGVVSLPDGPGLGIEIDEPRLEELAQESVRLEP